MTVWVAIKRLLVSQLHAPPSLLEGCYQSISQPTWLVSAAGESRWSFINREEAAQKRERDRKQAESQSLALGKAPQPADAN